MKTTRLSAIQFKALAEKSPHLIARSRWVAPVLGTRSLGHFEVQHWLSLAPLPPQQISKPV